MVAQLLADPKGAYFEIEGHTDNVGDATLNKKIGADRAEAVLARTAESVLAEWVAGQTVDEVLIHAKARLPAVLVERVQDRIEP